MKSGGYWAQVDGNLRPIHFVTTFVVKRNNLGEYRAAELGCGITVAMPCIKPMIVHWPQTECAECRNAFVLWVL